VDGFVRHHHAFADVHANPDHKQLAAAGNQRISRPLKRSPQLHTSQLTSDCERRGEQVLNIGLSLPLSRVECTAASHDMKEGKSVFSRPPRGRLALVIASSALMFSPLLRAQTADIYLGYSFVSSNVNVSSGTGGFGSRSTGRASLNGWEASASLKILPWIRGVADVGGGYGTVPVFFSSPIVGPSQTVNVSTTLHTYLFGPRAAVSVGHITPFAHALFGVAHQSVSREAFIGNVGERDSVFAFDLGAGIDFRLVRFVAWRVQGDYLQTHLFDAAQHDPRVSTGIVLRF
jgi:hypothetical protein